MKTYKITFERENGTTRTDRFTANTESEARCDFAECYRHGKVKIVAVEALAEKISKSDFTAIVAEYMEKWIEPLRAHAREHINEWYQNDVAYAIFVEWHHAKKSALFWEVRRYSNPEEYDESYGKSDRKRAEEYSEVIYSVLLKSAQRDEEKPRES